MFDFDFNLFLDTSQKIENAKKKLPLIKDRIHSFPKEPNSKDWDIMAPILRNFVDDILSIEGDYLRKLQASKQKPQRPYYIQVSELAPIFNSLPEAIPPNCLQPVCEAISMITRSVRNDD